MARRVVVMIQARMGSSRLPGKVLADLCGRPLLAVLLDRLEATRLADEVMVATSDTARDDELAAFVAQRGVGCFRGSEDDCLDRYYQAARAASADVVVRLTADNPLVDADFVDWALEQFSAPPGCDYLATSTSGGFPLGLSVEVFTMAALETAWREDRDAKSREHVTPFLVKHPERFRHREPVANVDASSLRWTVDTLEDLEYVRRLFESFGGTRFTWRQALERVRQHPEWSVLNRHVKQREAP